MTKFPIFHIRIFSFPFAISLFYRHSSTHSNYSLILIHFSCDYSLGEKLGFYLVNTLNYNSLVCATNSPRGIIRERAENLQWSWKSTDYTLSILKIPRLDFVTQIRQLFDFNPHNRQFSSNLTRYKFRCFARCEGNSQINFMCSE